MNVLWDVLCDRFRAGWLRLRGARMGEKVRIGARCRVSHPAGVRLGARCWIEGEAWFKMAGRSARLEVGAQTFIGRGCHLNVLDSITIGAHTLLGPGCVLVDHNHGTLAGLRIDQQPCVAKPISIGSDVWCGAGVVVLPGVTIGDGAVVGAQAVVTHDVPPMTVVAGNPARILRNR